MMQLISLIVPCYNESKSIDIFIETIIPLIESIPNTQWEIIFIDDGSQDNTLNKITALTKQSPIFRVIELSRNFGKEAALTAGLDAASGAAIIPIDIDLQDPPQLIATMIDEWRNGAEIVVARRIDRSSDTFLKRHTSNAFYKFHNAIAKIKIPENVRDFRLVDRYVVDALKQFPERQRFMKGLFSWVGFRTVTIDYIRPARRLGDSKFSGLALWNLAMEGLTSFSTIPLRIWTYIGGIGALLALLYGGLILIRTLVIGNPVPGYTSLFVAITFFGSVQLISIGLLGEYIGRIYMETKQRPTYIIRKTYDNTEEFFNTSTQKKS